MWFFSWLCVALLCDDRPSLGGQWNLKRWCGGGEGINLIVSHQYSSAGSMFPWIPWPSRPSSSGLPVVSRALFYYSELHTCGTASRKLKRTDLYVNLYDSWPNLGQNGVWAAMWVCSQTTVPNRASMVVSLRLMLLCWFLWLLSLSYFCVQSCFVPVCMPSLKGSAKKLINLPLIGFICLWTWKSPDLEIYRASSN